MKNFKLLLLAVAILASYTLTAQVAITTDGSSADPSAGLEVKFTDKGFLPPRMTEVQRDAISDPATGLMIYNLTTNCIDFFIGTQWISICGNQTPVASDVSFNGILSVDITLTGSYTYSDYESDLEGASTYQWYRADDASGTNQTAIDGATAETYELITADISKFIAFEVTPAAQTGSSPGETILSVYQGIVAPNQAPVTSDVSFSGTLEVDQTLTGSYTYSDYEDDAEGASTYQWYRADDALGTNQATIGGATAITYMLVGDDLAKFIAFQVTPVAENGASPGTAVMSDYNGSVAPVPWAIGDSYQGGIIAYIDGTGNHGLIAAIEDQSDGASWITGGSTQTTLNGNTSPELGTGQANTNFMMAQTGYTDGAAKVCDDYTNTETGTGVYSDWFLPSANELEKLDENKDVIGGFSPDTYWSSSEHSSTEAFPVQFGLGDSRPTQKHFPMRIRAVRAF